MAELLSVEIGPTGEINDRTSLKRNRHAESNKPKNSRKIGLRSDQNLLEHEPSSEGLRIIQLPQSGLVQRAVMCTFDL
jgi:hypothetical protein